jgi:lysophospholipase
MTGTVSPLYEPAMLLKRAGVIPGHDMTSEAALAKLSYLLALPDLSTEQIIPRMSVSLRGEFTEQTSMVFEHPHGVLPAGIANLTSLGYAISKGNDPQVQGLLKGDLGWLLNEADYSGNTPLVGNRKPLPKTRLKS